MCGYIGRPMDTVGRQLLLRGALGCNPASPPRSLAAVAGGTPATYEKWKVDVAFRDVPDNTFRPVISPWNTGCESLVYDKVAGSFFTENGFARIATRTAFAYAATIAAAYGCHALLLCTPPWSHAPRMAPTGMHSSYRRPPSRGQSGCIIGLAARPSRARSPSASRLSRWVRTRRGSDERQGRSSQPHHPL